MASPEDDPAMSGEGEPQFVGSSAHNRQSQKPPLGNYNNPRGLDMPPELASFLQDIDNSMVKSRSAPPRAQTTSPNPHDATYVTNARQPSPRGVRDSAGTGGEPTVTSTARQPSPRGMRDSVGSNGEPVTTTARQPSPRGVRRDSGGSPSDAHVTFPRQPSPREEYQAYVPIARQPSPDYQQQIHAQQLHSPVRANPAAPRAPSLTYATTQRITSQQYTSPPVRSPSVTSPGAQYPRAPSQQYNSPPHVQAKQVELHKIQQHRQMLLKQLNHLQSMEISLQTPDFPDDESFTSTEEYPGASYEQLMSSLPPPNSTIPVRKFTDPHDMSLSSPELEPLSPPFSPPLFSPPPFSPPPLQTNFDYNYNYDNLSRSMTLRPAPRSPTTAYRERFATVSSPTRPPFGLVLNDGTYNEFFVAPLQRPNASQPTSPTSAPVANTFSNARSPETIGRLVTAHSESSVNKSQTRRSLATPIQATTSTNELKRASTYGMQRVDPDKDTYQLRREPRKPTAGLPKLLLTVHLIDNATNKLVVATEDFRVQDLLYTFAEQLDLKQTDFFYLCVIYDKNPNIYRWLNPQKSLREEGVQANSYLMMKIKYFKLPKKLIDPVAIHLYYLQIAHHIVAGDYPASPPTVMKLAAIQFTMQYGTHRPSIHKPGFVDAEALKVMLPKSILDTVPTRNLFVRLYNLHSKCVAAQPLQQKLIYLDSASSIPTFGMTPFDVMDSVKDPNRTQRIFGVAEDGVFLSKKNRRDQLDFYSYDNMVKFEVKLRGFEVVMRDPVNPEIVTSIELEPLHPEIAHTIVNLINGYCLFLVFDNEEKYPLCKYGHLNVVNDEPLPHPSIFHPPKERNLSPPRPSRLSLLRSSYVDKCKELKQEEIQSFLLQIDTALDSEEIMTSMDVAKCGMHERQMFQFSRVVAKCFSLKDPGHEIIENLSLTSLDISNNTVGQEAAEAIKTLLEASPSIKILKLRNVGLGEKGTQLLVEVLEKYTTLEVIDVSGNSMNNSGISAVVKAIRLNKNLREFYSDLNLITEKVAIVFAQLVEITPTLTHLSLAKNKLGSKGTKIIVEGLQKNKSIVSLNLSSNQTGTKHMKALFEWFLVNPAIKKLYLADNKLTTQTGLDLAKVLASKEVALQVIDITLNDLGPKGTKEVIKTIRLNTGLTELHLSGNKISDKGAKLLCESLELSPSLNKLAIRFCSLGKGALKSLARVVTPHRQLKFLDVALNEMSHSVAVVFGALLAQNATLEVLHLSNCSLGAREIVPIISALPRNTKLKKLYLDVNKIGKAGLISLAQAICANESLVTLSLRNIETTAKEVDEFLRGLTKAKTLQKVNLKFNGLTASYHSTILTRIPFRVIF